MDHIKIPKIDVFNNVNFRLFMSFIEALYQFKLFFNLCDGLKINC